MLHQHASGEQLRIAHHLGNGIDRAGDHARGAEGGDDVTGLACFRPVADDRVDFVLVSAAGKVVDETFVGRQLRLVHRRAQPTEDAVLVGRDHHPTVVGGPVNVRRRETLQSGARGPANDAADVVVGDGGLLHGQAGLDQRDVNDLALPGEGAAVQRGERTLGGEHAGQGVAEGERHPRRWSAWEAVHVPQSAGRFGHRRVARLPGVRTGLAVAGNPHQDDAGIALAQNVVSEIPLLQRAGPEVLHDDVGALDEV